MNLRELWTSGHRRLTYFPSMLQVQITVEKTVDYDAGSDLGAQRTYVNDTEQKQPDLASV